jgi:catechol 2,3-dioxygenase-like lactoylglutathione lyase family enzyme
MPACDDVTRSAPMPSLENLKKQAKSILSRHRNRHYTVATQIRRALPRFRDMSDDEVLRSELRLADAQEVVARESGFESWSALKKGIATMTAPARSADSAITFVAAEPNLFVADLKASCAFFVDTLGFAVVFTYGEPPFYGQVKRGAAALNLRHVDRSPIDDAMRRREDLLSASITVENVKALFLEYQAAGAAFHQTLRKEPWGARTFIVRDPDGNLLLFAGAD